MATLDLQYRVYKNPGQAQKRDRLRVQLETEKLQTDPSACMIRIKN